MRDTPYVDLTNDPSLPPESPPFIKKRLFFLAFFAGVLTLIGGLAWYALRLESSDSAVVSQPFPTFVSTAEPLAPTLEPSPAMPPPPSHTTIPPRKNLPNGTHTFQTFNNCGPAALSMALSHYGITVSQQELGQALRPFQQAQGNNDDKSVTLAEVAAKAQEYGFTTYRRPAGSMEIIEALIAQDMPVIARTWLNSGEDIGHYRVITGYNQATQTLIQDDSLQGRQLSYTYDDFTELWAAFNYEFLVLVPPEKVMIAQQILGDLADEEAAWEKALALAESQLINNSTALYPAFNKAVALYYLGRYQEAISVYESVAERLPARMLWYQLEPVMAYYKVGDFQTVLDLSQNILSRNNRAYSELYYLRGSIYQQQGQASLAEENFAQATRYNESQFWKENVK